MKVVAIIPIKSNSERIIRKNFQIIGGKPLYTHIINHALEANVFEKVIVDTDSEEISAYALSKGAVIIQRKPSLTKNTANGNDLLKHHGNITLHAFDLYFQLFATAPFLKPETIRECVMKLEDSLDHDSIFTATEEKGWFWMNGNPVNFRPEILPRSQDATHMVKETTGLYGITKESLVKYGCRIGAKPIVHLVSHTEAIDIDELDDLERAQAHATNND